VISLAKTNTELSNVKINMRIDLASKLEGILNYLINRKKFVVLKLKDIVTQTL
jgi:hypothetical protein